jgi:hypothetical protein
VIQLLAHDIDDLWELVTDLGRQLSPEPVIMAPNFCYRKNADDCRERSRQARLPADKANWLKIAAEWQELAESVGKTSRKDGA